MKRYIAVVMLLIMFASPASAFFPVVVGAFVSSSWGAAFTASLTLHLTAWGIYMYSKRNGNAHVVGDNIASTQSVHWVDLTNSDLTEKKTDATATVQGDDVVAAALANPTKYPNLKAATGSATMDNPDIQTYTDYPREGHFFFPPGGTKIYKPTVVPWNETPWGKKAGWQFSNTAWCVYASGMCYGGMNNTAPTPQVAVTAAVQKARVAEALKTSVSDDTVKTVYAGEIDDFITSNPNVVHFEPDDLPPIPDQAKIDAQIIKNSSTVAQTEAQLARAASTAAAAAAAGGAHNTAVTARYASDLAAAAAAAAAALANASPGDPVLAAAAAAAGTAATRANNTANTAETAAGTAAATAAAAAADEAEANTDIFTTPNPSAYGGGVAPGSFGTRFTAFTDAVKGSSLFSLPAQIFGTIPSGGDSVSSVNFGRFGGVQTFDWALLSAFFLAFRQVLLIVFSVVGFRIVTKGGGG